MSESERYTIEFRKDQCELIVDVCEYAKKRMLNEGLASPAHQMARKFVFRRLDEVIAEIQANVP